MSQSDPDPVYVYVFAPMGGPPVDFAYSPARLEELAEAWRQSVGGAPWQEQWSPSKDAADWWGRTLATGHVCEVFMCPMPRSVAEALDADHPMSEEIERAFLESARVYWEHVQER